MSLTDSGNTRFCNDIDKKNVFNVDWSHRADPFNGFSIGSSSLVIYVVKISNSRTMFLKAKTMTIRLLFLHAHVYNKPSFYFEVDKELLIRQFRQARDAMHS